MTLVAVLREGLYPDKAPWAKGDFLAYMPINKSRRAQTLYLNGFRWFFAPRVLRIALSRAGVVSVVNGRINANLAGARQLTPYNFKPYVAVYWRVGSLALQTQVASSVKNAEFDPHTPTHP